MLLKNCIEQNAIFAGIDLLNLEDFAVRGSYPHDYIIPTMEETTHFYKIAITVKSLVLLEMALK